MKRMYLAVLFLTFSNFAITQAMELQATENTAKLLLLRSNNDLELFSIRMDDLYVVSDGAIATINPKSGSYSYIDVPGTDSRLKSDISSPDNAEGISQLKVEWVKLSDINTAFNVFNFKNKMYISCLPLYHQERWRYCI